MVLPCKRR